MRLHWCMSPACQSTKIICSESLSQFSNGNYINSLAYSDILVTFDILRERPARVLGESIPWSSTSFWATTWLNPGLKNIFCISILMVKGGVSVAAVQLLHATETTSSFCFPSLAPLRDYLSASSSLSPFGHLRTCHVVVILLAIYIAPTLSTLTITGYLTTIFMLPRSRITNITSSTASDKATYSASEHCHHLDSWGPVML